MSDPSEDSIITRDTALKGTTYKVYRYILKKGRPMGISDVQKGLGLSSPSVSQYHIRKLLQLGMIREEQRGYVIDRVVFENVIRIGRISIPTQTGYLAFFSATLLVMLTIFKPTVITSQYLFALMINVAALLISILETRKSLKRL